MNALLQTTRRKLFRLRLISKTTKKMKHWHENVFFSNCSKHLFWECTPKKNYGNTSQRRTPIMNSRRGPSSSVVSNTQAYLNSIPSGKINQSSSHIWNIASKGKFPNRSVWHVNYRNLSNDYHTINCNQFFCRLSLFQK